MAFYTIGIFFFQSQFSQADITYVQNRTSCVGWAVNQSSRQLITTLLVYGVAKSLDVPSVGYEPTTKLARTVLGNEV